MITEEGLGLDSSIDLKQVQFGYIYIIAQEASGRKIASSNSANILDQWIKRISALEHPNALRQGGVEAVDLKQWGRIAHGG